VEVALGAQHRRTGVTDVEEGLQVGERVRRPHLVDRRVRQGDPVAGGKREHHLRLERALDVDVQLGLRQGADEAVKRCFHVATVRPR
jgi:hypothetical protein